VSRRAASAVFAAVLLLAAALYFGFAAAFDARESHAYSSGSPSSGFQLTAGREYQLAVRGGRDTLAARPDVLNQPQCSASVRAGPATALRIAMLPADSRATNVLATFIAPATGRTEIACAGWGPVFVDDSDDATFDRSGLFLLLAIGTLTAGTALALAAWHGRSERMISTSRPRDSDHIATGE
jgi:hypothetical protein